MPAVGGVARRATVITATRKNAGNLLVLDAGNSLAFDADPAKSSQGKTSIEAMNRMGYDAAALGPLDLALGKEALAARMAEAKFPLVSANATLAGTAERAARPYVIRKIGGHRVALVGLTGPADAAGFTVADPVEALSALLPEVRAAADVIVLLSTAGAEVDREIAAKFPEVDVILAGGGALPAPDDEPAQTAPRFVADSSSAGHAGRNLGRATLTFGADGALTRRKWARIKLGPEIAGDPAMLEWATKAEAGP